MYPEIKNAAEAARVQASQKKTLDNTERAAQHNVTQTAEAGTPQPPLGARPGFLGIVPGEIVPEMIPGKQNVRETSRNASATCASPRKPYAQQQHCEIDERD